MVDYKNQQNSNLGFIQTGSADASEAGIVLGAKSGIPSYYDWRALSFVLASNNPDYIGFCEHFIGQTTLNPIIGNDSSLGSQRTVNSYFYGNEAGMLYMTTSGTINHYVTIVMQEGWRFRTFNPIHYKTRLKVAGSLADRIVEIGLNNTAGPGGGVYQDYSLTAPVAWQKPAITFTYNSTISANWVVYISDDNAETAYDTGVAVDTDYHNFEVVSYPISDTTASARLDFYIDDSLVLSVADAMEDDVRFSPYITQKDLAGSTRAIGVDYWAIAMKVSYD